MNVLVDDNGNPCMIPEEDEAIYAYCFIALLEIIDCKRYILHSIPKSE